MNQDSCIFDAKENKIICHTCKISLDVSFLNKRCPRCHAVLMLKPDCGHGCKSCTSNVLKES